MATPITRIHQARLADQVIMNLINLQNDIRRNAVSHKQMANAGGAVTMQTLTGYIDAVVALYNQRIAWVVQLRLNPVNNQHLLDGIAARGWVESDVSDVLTSLITAIAAFSSAPKTTYEEISAACDQLLLDITAPLSLWPE